MDYSNYLQSFVADFPKLKKYGFTHTDDNWTYEQDLTKPDLFVRFTVTPTTLTVHVIDRGFDDDFLPFSVKDSNTPVKAEVETIFQDILAKCFQNTRRDVINYCETTYQTPHEAPWAELPDYCTFKTKHSQKWYALIMRIPVKRLKHNTDETLVDVVNLKLDQEVINSLIDHQHYFPAYHLNKRHWISVLLDQQTDLPKVKELIDQSYRLVERVNKSSQYWLVPSNRQYYDIEQQLSVSDELTWQPRIAPKVGDLMFIYEAKPVAAVKYKFIVTKTVNIAGTRLITIKLQKRYADGKANLRLLKENGVTMIRWPIHISEQLAHLIEQINQ